MLSYACVSVCACVCVCLCVLGDVILRVNTVELQWFEHHWDHKNLFETGVVRANEY